MNRGPLRLGYRNGRRGGEISPHMVQRAACPAEPPPVIAEGGRRMKPRRSERWRRLTKQHRCEGMIAWVASGAGDTKLGEPQFSRPGRCCCLPAAQLAQLLCHSPSQRAHRSPSLPLSGPSCSPSPPLSEPTALPPHLSAGPAPPFPPPGPNHTVRRAQIQRIPGVAAFCSRAAPGGRAPTRPQLSSPTHTVRRAQI